MTQSKALLRQKIAALAFVAAMLSGAPDAIAQSSVRGPLGPEHVPALKFQSFTPERWDQSSFAPPEAIQWWREARLGLFIHFGVASLKGVELGWGRQTRVAPDGGVGPIPDEIYDNLYRQFQIERFDAKTWVRVAREAGARYIVVVTKHHDGFHLWDTALSDYKITRSPFGRDYLKEIADACHEAGMPLGFYFAQREWYHPDYNPRGNRPGRDHRNYIDYLFKAVRELLTNYGKVDILWLDAAWWGGMFEEKNWDSERLYRMARELQPHILINNRASIPGDFDTPEQHVGHFQAHRPWESCLTLTKNWGYDPASPVKSLREVIALLVQTATGDGNLLLNTGPMPSGEISPGELAVLQGLGEWMRRNGQTLYGTRGGPWRNGAWGGSTFRGDTAYVHVLKWTEESITLPAINHRLVSARLLTGGRVDARQDERGALTLTVAAAERDATDTIIELRFAEPIRELVATSDRGSIFAGPGYGSVISDAATIEPSSHADAQPSVLLRTTAETAPWAIIDLGAVRNAKGIRITHPPTATPPADLEVLVSVDRQNWTRVWRADESKRVWEVVLTQFAAGAHVPGLPCRYVKFQLPTGPARSLSLEKVEVFGEPK